MEEKFNLTEYLSRSGSSSQEESHRDQAFQGVLEFVKSKLDAEWEHADDEVRGFRLEKETRAIIGYEEEVSFYKEKIRGILMEHCTDCRGLLHGRMTCFPSTAAPHRQS